MPTREDILGRLLELLPELRRQFGVSSLALFGSFARGDAGPESDIDVVVEFDRPATLFTLASLRLLLAEELGRTVDVVTPGGLRPAAREQAMREALRVA